MTSRWYTFLWVAVDMDTTPPTCPGCGKNPAGWSDALKAFVLCSGCQEAMRKAPVSALVVPEAYRNASLGDFPQAMVADIMRRCSLYRKSLLIYGSANKGKTHLLCSMAKDCHARGMDALYMPFRQWRADLRNAVGDGNVEEVKDRLCVAGVLFLDDLFVTGNGAFIDSCLYDLYDYRHCEGLPTYTTMNATTASLDTLDDRIRWRMREGGGLLELRSNYGA